MRWARLDSANVVREIITQDDQPLGTIKVPIGVTCEIGLVWNGWEFKQPVWTAFEFLQRFTESELEIVRGRAVSDPIVWRFLTFAQAAQEIDAGDSMTIAGMDYLVAVSILTQARRDEILAA
jgi:hypothetical protein